MTAGFENYRICTAEGKPHPEADAYDLPVFRAIRERERFRHGAGQQCPPTVFPGERRAMPLWGSGSIS